MKIENKKLWIKTLILLGVGALAYVLAHVLVNQIISGSLSRLEINLYVAGIILLSISFIFLLFLNARKGSIKLFQIQDTLNLQKNLLEARNIELEDLTMVMGKLNQAIVIISNLDKVVWVNNSFYRMFGYTEGEVIGAKVSMLIAGPKTDINIIKRIDESIFDKKAPVTVKVIHYRKNGSSFWARVDITPLFDENGELSKYIAVSSDITPEVEAEQMLEQSEANFRQISETIEETFYLYDIVNKKYDFISENCASVLGVSNDFFYAGDNWDHLKLHKDDEQLLDDALAKVEGGEAYSIEYRLKKNGKWCWIKEQSFPIENGQGEVVRNSGICSDITERKLTAQKLEKSYEDTHLLAEIGLQITEELSLVNVIKKIHSNVNKLMDATCFAIGLADPDNNTIDFPLFIEKDEIFENVSYSLYANVLPAICYHTERAIIVNDIEKDSGKYTDEALEITHGENPESLIYLPIVFKEEVIGVVTVQSFEKNAYTEHQLLLLKSLSVNIASAVVNARHFENVEEMVKERTNEVWDKTEQLLRSHKDIELLSWIGLKIASSLSIEDIFDSLHQHMNRLLDAEVFGIRLYHPDRSEVEYKYEIESGERDEAIFISMNDKDNYTVWCIENKQEVIINDNEKEFSKYVSEIRVPSGEMPHSLLFCPMLVDDRVIGVVTVQSFEKNAYDDRHLNIFRTLVSYTSSALRNAQLYESLDQKVVERTKELAKKNAEITSSINYAKRIQKATMPAENQRKELLPESFVLYKPKDIVSGDFYRVDEIQSNTGEKLIEFTVADCTGHGVPGASLAMLCTSLLKQSLTESTVNSPGEALEFIREKLATFFENTSEEDALYDGMDVGVGVINPATNALYFAGAGTDCYVARNNDLIRLKGSREHVGFAINQTPFETQTLQLEPNDTIYLTSDGYLDQFGGPDMRKFMITQFKELMLEATQIPIQEQKQLFMDRLEAWQGKQLQTDDICLMGIKVSKN
jgi:PAS domain S-box-containing protein